MGFENLSLIHDKSSVKKIRSFDIVVFHTNIIFNYFNIKYSIDKFITGNEIFLINKLTVLPF